jgi:hypothetical protein
MGKEEPSSHAATAQPQQNAVFVNGTLAVPDAPANTDTVPAKFSQKKIAIRSRRLATMSAALSMKH